MRLRRRREKPKAAPAPRRGSGAGTFCVKSVVNPDILRGDEAVKFCETEIFVKLEAKFLVTGPSGALTLKGVGVLEMPVMVEATRGLPATPIPAALVCTVAVSNVEGVPKIATL